MSSPNNGGQQANYCCNNKLHSLSQSCCPSTVRYVILLLSFCALSSQFANLQLFNLAVLYTNTDQQRLLLPEQLGGADERGKLISPGNVQWHSAASALTPTSNSLSDISNHNSTTRSNILSKEFAVNTTTASSSSTTIARNVTESFKTTKGDNIKPRKRVKTRHAFPAPKDEKMAIVEQAHVHGDYEEQIDDENGGEQYNPSDSEQRRVHIEWMQAKIHRFAQSLLFSAPGITMLIAHFPCYTLIRRFGAHKPVFAALFLSGTITAAFPFFMDHLDTQLALIMLARILLGVCLTPAFTFLGMLAARWATAGEQFCFVLLGFMAIQFGPMVSWMCTVLMLRLDHYSRVQTFGMHGVLSLVLALFWMFFYRDQPQKHQLVNGEELNHIVKGKPRVGRPIRLPTSLFCLLLCSTSAWACWLAAFCYFFAQLTLLIFFPVFIHRVLRQTISYSLVLPLGLLFISHIIFHAFASSMNQSPNNWRVRLFNSIGFFFSALIFIVVTILPGNNELYAYTRIWFLWICLFPLGACSLGFIRSTVSSGGAHFTQHIVSHMQLPFAFAYALVPTLLFSSISERSIIHWRLLFLCCALLLLLGAAVFLLLGRGTPASWAEQWIEDERGGDAPLLLVKFSSIHNNQPGQSHDDQQRVEILLQQQQQQQE